MGGHKELDTATLLEQLSTHRENLSLFMGQSAKYTSLNQPTHIAHQIKEAEDQITSIQAELDSRGETYPFPASADASPAPVTTTQLGAPGRSNSVTGSGHITNNSTWVFALFVIGLGFSLVTIIVVIFLLRDSSDSRQSTSTVNGPIATTAPSEQTPAVAQVIAKPPELTATNRTGGAEWNLQVYNNLNLDGSPVGETQSPGTSNGKGGYSYTYDPTTILATLSIPAHNMSLRLNGSFAFMAGEYHFHCQHQDGCRVNVDRKNIIDAWWEGAGGHDQNTTLAAGTHTVLVEYFDKSGQGGLEIWWERLAAVEATETVVSPASLPARTCREETVCEDFEDALGAALSKQNGFTIVADGLDHVAVSSQDMQKSETGKWAEVRLEFPVITDHTYRAEAWVRSPGVDSYQLIIDWRDDAGVSLQQGSHLIGPVEGHTLTMTTWTLLGQSAIVPPPGAVSGRLLVRHGVIPKDPDVNSINIPKSLLEITKIAITDERSIPLTDVTPLAQPETPTPTGR